MNIRCPNNCKPDTDTPFFYAPSAFSMDDDGVEQGILADKEGEPVDHWTDGTVGIPPIMMDMLRGGDDLPYCIECKAEAELVRDEGITDADYRTTARHLFDNDNVSLDDALDGTVDRVDAPVADSAVDPSVTAHWKE